MAVFVHRVMLSPTAHWRDSRRLTRRRRARPEPFHRLRALGFCNIIKEPHLAAPSPPSHAADPSFWTQFQLLVIDGGLRFVIGIAILTAGWMLATWAKRGLDSALTRLPIDLTLKPLISAMARYIILLLTLLLVVGEFGVQTTSLIAVLGAAGLAIGLAL